MQSFDSPMLGSLSLSALASLTRLIPQHQGRPFIPSVVLIHGGCKKVRTVLCKAQSLLHPPVWKDKGRKFTLNIVLEPKAV